MDPDQELQSFIEEYGWAVMLVGHEQPFGYTIGISKTFGQPELFISGLSFDSIHELCNDYGQKVKNGETFQDGDRLQGWLDGDHEMMLLPVDPQYMPFFMGKALDHLGPDVPALQAVWSLNGVYPWDEDWPESLREAQIQLSPKG